MDRQTQPQSHPAKDSQSVRLESGLTTAGQTKDAAAASDPNSARWSPQHILQMQRIMGNRSVAQLLSRQKKPVQDNHNPQSTPNLGGSVIQRWEDKDSDETIIDEVLSELGSLTSDVKVVIDKKRKRIIISMVQNSALSIEIEIQPVSEAESGQPIFIGHGSGEGIKGVKSYILYVVKALDQKQIKPLLNSAIKQIQDLASETPGFYVNSEKEKTKSSEVEKTSLSGIRKLEDDVVQSIQTDIPDTALWETLLQWLPHLDEHENKKSLSAQFSSIVKETASALKLTSSAATRFLTQISEFYLRFHCSSSDREKSTMPTTLIDHLHKVTEKTRLSREQYLKHLKENSSNTDGDFEKTGKPRKTVEPSKLDEPTTIVPTGTVKKDEPVSLPTVDDDLDGFFGNFDMGDVVVEEEISLKDEFKFLFDKIKKEKHTELEKEIGDHKDTNGAFLHQLNIFCEGKMDEKVFLSTVKRIDDKKYLTDLTGRLDLGLTIPDNFTERVVKKPELRDTLPTKKTIDNAVNSFFISEVEAEYLVKTIGFHTAARMISYYRKNNAMSAIRGLIDQLKGSLEKVNSSSDQEELFSPITDSSLILDTNIAKALLMDESEMNPEEQQVKLITTELLKGGTVKEIRLPNMVIGELVQFGTNVIALGSKKTPDIPWKPMPIADKRDGSNHQGQYASDLLKLEQQQVGGSKGAPDRQLVVESLHALKKGEDTQTRLITADKGITKHLRTLYLEQVGEKNKNLTDKETPIEPVADGKPFLLEMGSNKLTIIPVNATVSEEDKQTDFYSSEGIKGEPITDDSDSYTKIVAPKEGPAAILFDKPIGKEDSPVLVKDLIELISANQYDVTFVGGAVRDSVRGESPNDIDLTTNMHIDSLMMMLKKDTRFGKIPQNIVKTEKMHLLQLAIQSEFSVDITCDLGPQNKKAKSFDEDGFYEKDAKKRDFTMNSLYLDKNGKLHDPTGRGVSDALTKNLFSSLEGFINELEDAKSYDLMGRLMKFSARDYHVADEQIKFVHKRMVDLILKARNDKELGTVKLNHILESARERTPVELIEVLRDLGFSDKLIRQLFPDSPSGFYEDGTPNYKHNLVPSRLVNPESKKLQEDGLPDVKYDAETGRLYQYRMFVKDIDKEDLIVDMDLTDHGLGGHTSPHYHLYRWIEDSKDIGKWDKHSQGMSATGEPGKPAVEGGQYVGPRPWNWTKLSKEQQSITKLIESINLEMKKDNIEMEIEDKGDGLMSFADEITIHIVKIRELMDKNKLAEFLMFVHKTSEKGKLPYSEDMSSVSMISSGGERLRFEKHKFEITTMLTECGVDEVPAEESHWIRLFDLLHYKKEGTDSTLLKSAAKWSDGKAEGNWLTFVERFEFYISAMGKTDTKKSDEDIDDMYDKLKVNFKAGEQLSDEDDLKLSLKKHEEEIVDKASNGKLGFNSESAAKYHYLKHGDDLQVKFKESSYSFDQYLASAMSTIATGKLSSAHYEQLGSQSFVFIKDENKAIVRVETDSTANLATFYANNKKEQGEESVRDFGELLELSTSKGMSKGEEQDKSGKGDINRLFGSLEYFIHSARSHVDKGSKELAAKQAKGAEQVLNDIIIPMFYAKLDQFKPDYVEETIKRISSFREQMDFLGNVSEQLKEQQTIAALIDKLDRDIKLMGLEINKTVETIKKAASTKPIIIEPTTELSLKVPEQPEWIVELDKKLKVMEVDLEKKQIELEKLKKFAEEVLITSESSSSENSPKGLSNIGNSCYIGSIMQLMAIDDTYANLFLTLLPVETTPPAVRELQLSGQPIISKIRLNQQVSGEEIATFRRSLLRNGWISGNEMRIASQQDASELFVFLTDKLKFDDLLEVTTSYELEIPKDDIDSTESMLVLSGMEEGMDLNHLIEKNMTSIVEKHGDEHNVKSTRKFKSLPDVLTIQLARFEYSRELQRVVKIDTNVPIIDRKLTIDEELTTAEDDDVEYEMESFILHIGGSPTQGHYVGYFKRDDQWYGYNDSVVRPVSNEQVDAVSKKAYMLCFHKV